MEAMENKAKILLAEMLITLTLIGCTKHSQVANSHSSNSQSASQASNSSSTAQTTPTRTGKPEDEWWYSKHPGWYEAQLRQDCPEAQQDQLAIDVVLRAHRGDKAQFKFGEKDPFNRKPDPVKGFKSQPNPLGEGTIISAYIDNERGADYSRRRSVWLVLDKRVYPLNIEAARNVGVLFDGPPSKILTRAGLNHSYKPGEIMLNQLRFEEYTSVRKFSGGNPFPECN